MYICHCCSVIVYFLLFRNYKIVIIYQKSNSYSFDYQKNSYFFVRGSHGRPGDYEGKDQRGPLRAAVLQAGRRVSDDC